MAMARLQALEGLRLVFSVWVVYYHLIPLEYLTHSRLLWSLMDACYPAAIHFFFILTGYGLAAGYGKITDLKAFYIGRIRKLVKLFYISVVLVGLCQISCEYQSTMEKIGWNVIWDIVRILLLVQCWFPRYSFTGLFYNGPAYAICITAFLYLVFPAVNRWIRHRNEKLVISVCIVYIFVCNVLAGYAAFNWTNVFPPYHIGQLIIGVMVCDIARKRPKYWPNFTVCFVFSVIAVLFVPFVFFMDRTAVDLGIQACLHAISFSGLLISANLEQESILHTLVSKLPLRKYSYGIFILQNPVACLLRCYGIGNSGLLGVCVILVGILVEYFVEKFGRMVRNRLKRESESEKLRVHVKVGVHEL